MFFTLLASISNKYQVVSKVSCVLNTRGLHAHDLVHHLFTHCLAHPNIFFLSRFCCDNGFFELNDGNGKGSNGGLLLLLSLFLVYHVLVHHLLIHCLFIIFLCITLIIIFLIVMLLR